MIRVYLNQNEQEIEIHHTFCSNFSKISINFCIKEIFHDCCQTSRAVKSESENQQKGNKKN